MRTNLVKKKDTKSPLNDGMLDMVIAFDTTGSMCAYIEAVKLNIKKMQFVSRDGKYKCMDMDIKRTGKETGERYVNINTISHLIYNGVKYVVE